MRVSRLAACIALAVASCEGVGTGTDRSAALFGWELVGGGAPSLSDAVGYPPYAFTAGGALHVTTWVPDAPVMKLSGASWAPAIGGALPPGTSYVTSDGERIWVTAITAAPSGGAASVLRWDDGAWRAVGPAIALSSSYWSLDAVRLAFDGFGPIVAWTEWPGATGEPTIGAARWNGSTWAPIDDLAGVARARVLDLVSDPAGAVMAYEEGGVLQVARFRGSRLDSYASVPGAASATGSVHAALAAGPAGDLYVAATTNRYDAAAPCAVYRWAGTAWQPLGAIDPESYWSGLPRIAVPLSGWPLVTWTEAEAPMSRDRLATVHAAQWNGRTWARSEATLNMSAAHDASFPLVVLDAAGAPVVAWSESTGAAAPYDEAYLHYRVFVKRLLW